jgi:hypothetical protein
MFSLGSLGGPDRPQEVTDREMAMKIVGTPIASFTR